MGKEIPPELHRVLRRLDDITSMHKEKLDFIQGRWDTLHRRQPPSPEEVRRLADRADAPPELKAVAVAVRDGRTTWAKVIDGDADDLPEVQALCAAHRDQLLEELHAPVAPARRPRTHPGLDDHEATIFESW